MNSVQNSFGFLVENIFEIAMLLVLLRFLFQVLKVNFRNPIVEMVVNVTRKPLTWLRRFVPGIFGIDLSAVVLVLGLGWLKMLLLSMINGAAFSVIGSIFWTFANLINTTFWVFIIAIIIHAIMSWFMPHPSHPAEALLSDMTRPLVTPVRRFMPDLGGLDLSPLVVLLGLQFLQKLLMPPLLQLARAFF